MYRWPNGIVQGSISRLITKRRGGWQLFITALKWYIPLTDKYKDELALCQEVFKRNKKYPSLFAGLKTGPGTIASIAPRALARYAPDRREFQDGPSQPGK